MTSKDLIDFIFLALLYIFVFYRIWKAKGKQTLFINTIMYIYLCLVLYFTLMPIITSLPHIFSHHYRAMNLTPFIDVLNQRGDFTRQILLNVLMTIPFGFLLPFVKEDKTNFAKVLLYTFLLSFGIEILQPLISTFRSSDITDIITNVIGGAIGYLLYICMRPSLQRFISPD